jgi:hypothetical protein
MLIRPLHGCDLAGWAVGLLIASATWAQEVKSSTPSPSDAGLLAGPPVEEEATVQNGGRQGLVPGARRQQESLPIRVWISAVRDLGLSPEQQSQVQAIVNEFQAAQRRYQQEHGERMRGLQQQARDSRAAGKEPEPAVREALQKLDSESPKAIDAQRRIWGVLNETQQARMRERLTELEKQAQERRRTDERAADAGPPTRTPNAQPPTTDAMMGGAAEPKPLDNAMTSASDMDGMMSGAMDGTAGEAANSNQPTMRERARERRRDAANAAGALDDNARRRLAFLEQHQAAGRAGNAPSAEERTFKFAEDEDKD